MDTHKNARLTPKGREEMVRAVADRGMSKAAAAHQFNTTPKTVGKWVDRFCAEGVDGSRDGGRACRLTGGMQFLKTASSRDPPNSLTRKPMIVEAPEGASAAPSRANWR